MIFTGNPGTGKTTIARLVSRYLKAIGVLSGGQLVEVTRADLVGRYVGHTAPLTTQVLKSAWAASCCSSTKHTACTAEKNDSFGLEAIDTLVKGMEDTGTISSYPGRLFQRDAEFLTANSGLKSRFQTSLNPPIYYRRRAAWPLQSCRRAAGGIRWTTLRRKSLAFQRVQLTRARGRRQRAAGPQQSGGGHPQPVPPLVAQPEADLCLLLARGFPVGRRGRSINILPQVCLRFL
jgi:hypothetical protein